MLLLLSREMLLLWLREPSAGGRCAADETLGTVESIGEDRRSFFVVIVGGCSSYSVLMPTFDNLAGVEYRPIISLIVLGPSFRVEVDQSLVDRACRCARLVCCKTILALGSIEGAIVHKFIG